MIKTDHLLFKFIERVPMDEIRGLRQEIAELTAARNRLESLLDMLPQIIVETDLRGNLTFANRKTFELTGYNREDFHRGLNAAQLVIPEERPLVVENVRRVLQGENLQGNEYTGLRKDGTTFPVLVYSSHKIENGQVSGVRSIIIDITERKKEEGIKETLIENLQKAAAEIKNLQGIIPICMHCKQIRDDQGFWSRVESYIEEHTDARFSHGVCPDCQEKHYSGFAKK